MADWSDVLGPFPTDDPADFACAECCEPSDHWVADKVRGEWVPMCDGCADGLLPDPKPEVRGFRRSTQ